MHLNLIKTVADRHDRVMIFLGLSPTKVTVENPLDYQMRRVMIEEAFPNVDVYYIDDVPGNNEQWSKSLDREIGKHIAGERECLLYGSRDSFLQAYSGKFKTAELVSERIISGSEIRKTEGNKKRASEDFRAGVIWATQNRHAVTYPTVDAAIFDEGYEKILLGLKRSDAGKYCLPGGFINSSLPTAEGHVRRESEEETGAVLTDPEYVCSQLVDDPRYPEGSADRIMTFLFAAKRFSGSLAAADDLDEIRWFTIDEIFEKREKMVVRKHLPLFIALEKWLLAKKLRLDAAPRQLA
jgi:bifunctional NMN adenylyltransferase/nudix hydrolase